MDLRCRPTGNPQQTTGLLISGPAVRFNPPAADRKASLPTTSIDMRGMQRRMTSATAWW
jgi:hypothetical protein